MVKTCACDTFAGTTGLDFVPSDPHLAWQWLRTAAAPSIETLPFTLTLAFSERTIPTTHSEDPASGLTEIRTDAIQDHHGPPTH